MKSKYLMNGIFILTGLFSVFSFQNCAPSNFSAEAAPEPHQTSSNLPGGDNSAASVGGIAKVGYFCNVTDKVTNNYLSLPATLPTVPGVNNAQSCRAHCTLQVEKYGNPGQQWFCNYGIYYDDMIRLGASLPSCRFPDGTEAGTRCSWPMF